MGVHQGHLVALCLTGDVMTGRGIDPILPYLRPPGNHEPAMDAVLGYDGKPGQQGVRPL